MFVKMSRPLDQSYCKIANKRGSKGQPPLCGGLGASPSLFFLPRPQAQRDFATALTEHLLLGLLREEREPGGQVLRKSGVTLEKARELVKQLLAAEQPTSAPESEQHGES
jgi:hypothetical protein